jgi:biotin operon repressor
VFGFLLNLSPECEDFLWMEPAPETRDIELARALDSLSDRGVPKSALPTLRAAHAMLRARFVDVASATDSLLDSSFGGKGVGPAIGSDDSETLTPWTLEGRFLSIVASARLERVDLDASYHAHVAPGVERADRWDLRLAFAIEKATFLMGRGLYREALRVLPVAETMEGLPRHWALRASLVAGLSHQALGRYVAAGVELARQEALVSSLPLSVLRLGTARRRLSLLVESERLDEADDALEAAMPPTIASGNAPAHALLLDDGMRLRLLQGREDEARTLSVAQADVIATGDVPRTFLAGTESRCALALLDGPAETAARLILDEAWKAGSRGVFGAQCVAQMLLARALLESGGAAAATPAAQSAVALADRHGYGRDRVRALTLLASIRASDGDLAEARSSSSRALALARELALRLHVALLSLWRVLALGVDPVDSLEGLLADPGDPAAVRSLARASGLSVFETPWFSHSLPVHEANKPSTAGKPIASLGAVVVALRAGEVFHVVDMRALLAWESSRGLQVRTLGTSSARDALISRLLKRSARGETLAALHKVLWPRVAWHSDRHAKPLHAMLADCRAALTPLGIGIRARDGRYLIEPRPGRSLNIGNTSATEQVKGSRHGRRRAPTHMRAIVAHIEEHGPSSGAKIARALNITRQSLQPALVVLRERGILTFVGKGRHSLYALGGAAGDRKAP